MYIYILSKTIFTNLNYPCKFKTNSQKGGVYFQMQEDVAINLRLRPVIFQLLCTVLVSTDDGELRPVFYDAAVKGH